MVRHGDKISPALTYSGAGNPVTTMGIALFQMLRDSAAPNAKPFRSW
jgi:hypothetical protein